MIVALLELADAGDECKCLLFGLLVEGFEAVDEGGWGGLLVVLFGLGASVLLSDEFSFW